MLGTSPAGGEFIALLKAFRRSGGTAPSSLLAPLYAQHRFEGAPSVHNLIDGGDLFGFPWRAAFWIPLFQFDADRFTIKSVAREVRCELPPSWSGWELATWFAQPHALLEDRSPVDLLDAFAGDVLVAARSHRLGSAAKPTEGVMRFS